MSPSAPAAPQNSLSAPGRGIKGEGIPFPNFAPSPRWAGRARSPLRAAPLFLPFFPSPRLPRLPTIGLAKVAVLS
jgi:hypothetical protein